MQTINFEAARRNMIEYQIRCCKVLDPIVLKTLSSLPRENFLPAHVRSLAYMEGHVPLPCGQEMMSPLQEAHVMQSLELEHSERVMEIGSGTGYLTALIAMHAKEVISYEIHQELAELATTNLANHGIDNARVIHANAMNPEAIADVGMVDAIVIGAALERIPEHIREHVKEGGHIIAFLGRNPVVTMVRLTRTGNTWRRLGILETLLQDMEGLPETREFVF